MVALSFLTADCKENVVAAYDAGALELMLKLVDSKVAGERAAAATTLRNICVEDDKYRQSFVQLGGIQALVNQLDTKPDPSLNHADVQLEAVLNLQDMVETDDGQTIAEYATLAVKAGAIPKLQELEKSEDEEVRTSATEVLESLQDFAWSNVLSMDFPWKLPRLATEVMSWWAQDSCRFQALTASGAIVEMMKSFYILES